VLPMLRLKHDLEASWINEAGDVVSLAGLRTARHDGHNQTSRSAPTSDSW
jgi:hypothetical protein